MDIKATSKLLTIAIGFSLSTLSVIAPCANARPVGSSPVLSHTNNVHQTNAIVPARVVTTGAPGISHVINTKTPFMSSLPHQTLTRASLEIASQRNADGNSLIALNHEEGKELVASNEVAALPAAQTKIQQSGTNDGLSPLLPVSQNNQLWQESTNTLNTAFKYVVSVCGLNSTTKLDSAQVQKLQTYLNQEKTDYQQAYTAYQENPTAANYDAMFAAWNSMGSIVLMVQDNTNPSVTLNPYSGLQPPAAPPATGSN